MYRLFKKIKLIKIQFVVLYALWTDFACLYWYIKDVDNNEYKIRHAILGITWANKKK